MPDYEIWNQAIADYFTAGMPKGSSVFLSLDDEALHDIAARFLEDPPATPVQDFLNAVVRKVCSLDRSRVYLDGLCGETNGLPNGIAFLGALVFAAYDMQEEGEVNDNNYFVRLRTCLGLVSEQGRPDGLRPPGCEESLWWSWNQYLLRQGFRPTAERGEGCQTYLRYILSQAILRETDKQYLRERYRGVRLPEGMDCDQLGLWLSRQPVNRQHLREGLNHPDFEHVWEFYKAAYRVYESSNWAAGIPTNGIHQPVTNRNIECGLYRIEDLAGEAQYWLFPKQPGRTANLSLQVLAPQEGDGSLRLLRPGFFMPAWPVSPFDAPVHEWQVAGDPVFQKLLFPKRDFWILVNDPENSDGAWGTWKPYLELGEKFLLLCRPGEFAQEMERFQEAGLLNWSQRIDCGGWIEYHHCMVLSYDWGGFIASANCQALADALTPRSMCSIALSGGLQSPNPRAWIEGFPPTVKVYGFDQLFDIKITNSANTEVLNVNIRRQEGFVLPSNLAAGIYRIEVEWAGRSAARRLFRIITWEDVETSSAPEVIYNQDPVSTAGIQMCGAIIGA